MGSRVRTLFALGDTPQWGMDSVLMGSCMVYLREKGVYPVIIIDYMFSVFNPQKCNERLSVRKYRIFAGIYVLKIPFPAA